MNTVLSLIIMLSQDTLKIDITYVIARYIIEHMDEMKTKSIKQLAEDCFTSTTSINRFCQLIGYDSYSEFKLHLLNNFDVRQKQLDEKQRGVTEEQILKKIEFFSSQSFDAKSLSKQIDALVSLILEKRKIVFYGATFPLALTTSFMEDLAVLGMIVENRQMSRGNMMLEDQEAVHIMVSFSGRLMEVRKKEYKQICNFSNPSVLMSREIDDSRSVSMNVVLPQTQNIDDDDLIFLLVLDLIRLKLYESQQKRSS